MNRRNNNQFLCLKEAGLSYLRTEASFAGDVVNGPFDNNAHFDSLREHGEDLAPCVTLDDEAF